jgi:hypothetical protein
VALRPPRSVARASVQTLNAVLAPVVSLKSRDGRRFFFLCCGLLYSVPLQRDTTGKLLICC